MFLFLCLSYCSSLLKIIEPKELLSFYQDVTEDDQYASLSLGMISQASDIFYRIIPPATILSNKDSSEEDDDYSRNFDIEDFEKPLERNVNVNLEKPGVWTIQIYNRGTDRQKFSISCNSVKKINKGNEDILELRNLLNSIRTSVENLVNENYYAGEIHQSNIKEAERILSTLNWLVLVPVLTFLIAYGKYFCARQLVKPKGKRLKGFF